MADHDTHDHTGVPGVGGGTPDLDAVLAESIGQDIADALSGAASPDSGNVFATIADVTGGGGGAPASKVPVQEVVNTGSSANSQGATWGATPTNGNLLIACIESEGGTNVTSISQTGVTWTKVAESTASTSPHAEIWKGVVGSGASTSMTVNFSGTTFCGFHASEWNGITGTLDQSATVTNQAQVGTNTNKLPSITPTNNDALVIVCCAESTFSSSFKIVSPHVTTFWRAGNFGSDSNVHLGFGMGFGFPGTHPVYGWVKNPRGGTFSAVVISLT